MVPLVRDAKNFLGDSRVTTADWCAFLSLVSTVYCAELMRMGAECICDGLYD